MANSNGLIGLAFPAIGRPKDLDRVIVAHHLQIAPERRGDPSIIWFLDHRGQPSVLDELSPLAPELKFVSRIID